MDQSTIDKIEKNHLAIYLYRPDALYSVRHLVSSKLYSNTTHASIYNAIKSLREKNIIPDILLIVKEIGVSAASSVASISESMVYMFGENEAREYTEILFANYAKNFLNYSCQHFTSTNNLDVLESAKNLSKNIDSVFSELHNTSGETLTTEITTRVLKKIKTGESQIEHSNGLSWGITDLDNISKIVKKYVHVIGARPGMGKTSLIKAIVKANSVENNKRGLFVSLEITSEDFIIDMLALLAKVNNKFVRTGSLTPHQLSEIEKVAPQLTNNLIIDDRSGRTAESIIAQIRELKVNGGLDYVMIDFLQKMTFNETRGNTLDQKISFACKLLADAAKEYDVAIIELSQLGRKVEERPKPKPIMSDLKDSGDIESMAKMIVMLWRPIYYGITQDSNGRYVGDLAEFATVKNRYGNTGDVYAKFVPEYTAFEDISNETGIITNSNGNSF